MPLDLLEIGAVCRPHGLRGELRVRLHDPESAALEHVRSIWLGAEQSQLREQSPLKVLSSRRQDSGYYLVTLSGIPDRAAAESVREQRMFVERGALPALAGDEYYVADLVGCSVRSPEGVEIGVAAGVQNLGACNLLVVQRPAREDALVPLVPEFLLSVDLLQRSICIDPPEGLLDLDLG